MTVSPSTRVQQAFRRIEAVDRAEVWIALRSEVDVAADAEAVERRLEAGERLPLAGMLVAVKDNVDVAGIATTAGCPDYAYLPETTAPAVARLQAAGAVVMGKTNMDQFATGLVGTRSPYGPVRNAFDPQRISGGSSAGSAVAVALGVADIGIGTDTAGSGRVPAAFNGLVGLKATLGIVPTTGVVPACADYDAVTVFAAGLATACAALRVMAGPDSTDPRSRPWPTDAPLAAPPHPRVAIPRPEDLRPLTPAYRQAFDRSVGKAVDAGFEVDVVDISELLEAAKLLYDGAIVAQRFAAVGDFLATNPATADPTVAAIIRGGGSPGAVDYLADHERLLAVKARLPALLDGASALMLPTTTEHPTIAAVLADPVGLNRRLGTYTNFCNLLDMAAVAVPAGEADGLPFGIMFVVPAFADQVAVDLASRYQASAPDPCVVDMGIDLAVFGAHLRGQTLNHQLVALHARFVEEVSTTDSYRLLALATTPPKPGLVRAAPGAGAPITGELWRLSPAALGWFLADLPPPMTLTSVELADGRRVVGFGCTPEAAAAGTDITAHGGWLTYLASHEKQSR